MKLCKGRQGKTWRKVISELLLQINLDSQEILAYSEHLFLERVKELKNREYKKFNVGLSNTA